MSIDLQFKIRNNPNYIRYLRQHSIWYKLLNRNPERFREFEELVKEEYKLRTTDKIEHLLDTVELVQNILTTLK